MLWLIAALVLGIVEVTTLALVAGFFAGGALAAALVDVVGGGTLLQVVAFIVTSLALMAAVRPVVARHVTQPPQIRTGVAALIGRPAQVLERIDAHHGQVKLGGEIWTARPYDPSLVIEPGVTVEVMEIQGATALVYPQEQPWTT